MRNGACGVLFKTDASQRHFHYVHAKTGFRMDVTIAGLFEEA